MEHESSNSLQPVIVIGAARSGTKFLRDLIGASDFCRVAPHDVNYIWRYKNERLPHDSLTAKDCTQTIAKYIRKRLSVAARQSGAIPNGPSFLIEKTVSNCLRVPFVDQVFPKAVYVNLLRDGRNVVESSVRMWRAPVSIAHLLEKARYFPLRNLSYAAWYLQNVAGGWLTRDQGVKIWGVRYPGIEQDVKRLSVPEICAKQWRMCVETSIDDLAAIPSARVIKIRYESLISEENEVQRICEFLGLPDHARVLEHYREENRPRVTEGWCSAFDGREWEAAMEILLPALDRLGYD